MSSEKLTNGTGTNATDSDTPPKSERLRLIKSDSRSSVKSGGSSSEPSSPGEAFKDLKLRKNCGEILLSRYLKVSL